MINLDTNTPLEQKKSTEEPVSEAQNKTEFTDGMNPKVSNDGNEVAEGDVWAKYREENGKILGKYDDGEAFTKGYRELTAKLREKSPEIPASPDAYEIAFGDDVEGDLKGYALPKDDPLWSQMAPAFHELKLSNEQAKGIARKFLELGFANQKNNIAEQRKALGDEADSIIGSIVEDAKRANDPGAFILANLAGTNAQATKYLHRLINSGKEADIPSNGAVSTIKKSKDEMVQAAFEYRRSVSNFESNTAAQRKYEQMMTEAHS